MIAGLASSVVTSFLIPYIKQGVQNIAENVSQGAGDAVAKHVADVAKKVWDRVRAAFTEPEEKTILDQFEKRPDKAGPLMEDVLEEKLQKDVRLAKDLEGLVMSQAGAEGSTSLQVMNNYGTFGVADARGAVIHGTVAGVNIGANAAPSPAMPPKSEPTKAPK